MKIKHKALASITANEAASLFQTLLVESGLKPVACKPLTSGLRPGGSTIRVEFKEPVTVHIYNMRNGNVFVDVDLNRDDMSEALAKVSMEATRLPALKVKLTSLIKNVEDADGIVARDLGEIENVLKRLAVFSEKLEKLKVRD